MKTYNCQGQWALFEVHGGCMLRLVSIGTVIAWDVLKGTGKVTTDTRVWVGATTRRWGVMTARVRSLWATDEGYRFGTEHKVYELRPLKPSSVD